MLSRQSINQPTLHSRYIHSPPARLFQTLRIISPSLSHRHEQREENKMQSMKSMAKSSIPSVDHSGHFRKPLQPKNFNSGKTPTTHEKPRKIKILLPLPSPSTGDENKENFRIGGPFDASLADELVAMRRKMERLREERERTEEVLNERDQRLDEMMREMEKRWTEQRTVQIEVDRIRRLKQLSDSCTRIPPFVSLREIERKRKAKETQQQQMEKENEENEAIENVEKGKMRQETVEPSTS